MTYINWKYNGRLDTIDECKTKREAIKLAHEYRMAYGNLGNIYLSQRATKDWREK